MSIKPILAEIEKQHTRANRFDFDIGDSVVVQLRLMEGDKERLQGFPGIVISKRGSGTNEMFTVRRIVDGEGVERTFPMNSPKIASVEIEKKAIVRRAKLYFLRDRVGKRAYTLKERPLVKETVGRKRARVKARKEKQANSAASTAPVAAAKTRKPRVRKKKEAT